MGGGGGRREGGIVQQWLQAKLTLTCRNVLYSCKTYRVMVVLIRCYKYMPS